MYKTHTKGELREHDERRPLLDISCSGVTSLFLLHPSLAHLSFMHKNAKRPVNKQHIQIMLLFKVLKNKNFPEVLSQFYVKSHRMT